MSELWWSYEDTGDERLAAAWEEARYWEGAAYGREIAGYKLEVQDP